MPASHILLAESVTPSTLTDTRLEAPLQDFLGELFMRLKRFVGFALALATLSSTTGCAVGFGANTTLQQPSGDGRYTTAGDLEIRGATIVADPKDPSKGTLLVTIYNGGETDDALVGVTSGEVTGQSGSAITLGAAEAVRIGYNSASTVALTSANNLLVPGSFVALNLNFANTTSAELKLLVNANDSIYGDVRIP
jgi:hypothetical protein